MLHAVFQPALVRPPGADAFGGRPMQEAQKNPIDRLDYAVAALKGLGDLVAAARNLQEVRSDEIAVLFSFLTEELENCAKELRKH